ncbi:MAG: hypothetical protein GXP46_10270, partial [Deferribacteres bacterium]|nr:hypothetical protein [Deferribacteres bacterium]
TLNVFQLPIGYVTGTALSGGDLQPLSGWNVELWQIDPTGRKDAQGNPITYIWKATTARDGSFSFPGISVGEFRIVVEKSAGGKSLGSSTVKSRLTQDGEVVDIPVVVNLVEEPKGNISGIVYNPDGTLGADTKVCIKTCNPDETLGITTTDEQGIFSFMDMPLGRYRLIAESQTTHDTSQAVVDVSYEGETATITMTLAGLGTITGYVERSDGTTASGAEIRLSSSPPACEITIDKPYCVVYADSDGIFRFNSVPAGRFTIDAIDPVTTYKGSMSDTLDPGETKDIRIVLQATGSVTGRVLFSDGRPAGEVTIVLNHREEYLTLYKVSRTDGTFSFPAVPAGQVDVSFEDPAGIGVAEKTLTVLGDEDIGDVILDDTRPEVASVEPIAGARDVPLDKVIRITFSEPVLPGTVNQDTVRIIRDDGTVVQGIIEVSSGDTLITFIPLEPWRDETRYTIRLNANPPFDEMDIDHSGYIDRNEAGNNYGVLVRFDEYDTDGSGYLSRNEYLAGIQDGYGHVMEREFTSSFTTVDITPPSVVSIDPAPGTGGVSVEGVIRISYSEPIDPQAFTGPAITVTANGTPVEGRLDMIHGNTGAVFTPLYPLSEDTTYHVTILPATDLSGNVQTEGLSYDFTTTDRTPPEITGLILSGNGTVIEGGTASVTADTGTEFDISFVDFYINGSLAYTDRQPPFEMLFTSEGLGAAGDTINVSAVATDTSGNRGSSIEGTFTIVEDSAPVVSILSPATGLEADTGSRVEVRVRAEDDLGVTEITYQAIGGEYPAFGSAVTDPVSTPVESDFAFYVPIDASPGSVITVKASALDTKGQEGRAVPVDVIVKDATPPSVSITGLTTGEKVKPGDEVTAVVTAGDNGRISGVTFDVTGAAVYHESRDITPAQGSLVTSFTFTISPSVRPGDTITLKATVRDEAGLETTSSGVIISVADTIPPVVDLRTETGSIYVSPGEVVNIIAAATDEIGVTEVSLKASGAFNFSDTKQVSPPLGSAEVVFTITIPPTIGDGDIINLEALARDIAGNISDPATLTLTGKSLPGVTMPASIIMPAGDTEDVTLTLSTQAPQGGLRIDLESEDPSIAYVTPSIVIQEGETSAAFTVSALTGGTTIINAYIEGTKAGSMTVTVRGGVITGTVYNP